VCEDFLQALLKAINIVVDKVLSVDFALIDEADEGEALVNLPQVEHNVLLVISVGQSDDRGTFLVELAAVVVIVAVDAGDIDEHVDELGADLIVLHVDGRRVARNVHLRDHVKQERLLNLRPVDQCVHHLGDEGDLG